MDTPPKLPAGKKSFADVTYDEAMRRAEALIPLLKAHADESEKLTHMAPAVVSALHESGLLRYMQPKRWGGMELDFVSVFDLPEMLGRGDASAAWTFTNLAAHHRLLALWDARAQEEIWGDDPDMLIASGIAFAQGRAVKTDGGYRITGRWGFSSGVDVSTWNMLACQVFDGDKIVDYRMCLVPLPDFEVIDDWQTLGMRGTGSRTVQCKDIFVPEHRALSMYTQRPGFEYPGWKVNTAAQYRIPLSGFGGTSIGGLTDRAEYYVIRVGANSVKLAATLVDANAGTAIVQGWEFSYQQQLSFLPGWAKGLGVYANATKLWTKGQNSAFVTGWGLTTFTGPAMAASVRHRRTMPTASARAIQLSHWRPLPIRPPAPSRNGRRSFASMPPRPMTTPKRSGTTRTPASIAARVAPSHARAVSARNPRTGALDSSTNASPVSP